MKKLIFLFCIFCSTHVSAQQVLDDIVGVVGGHIVLESDITMQLEQMSGQGFPMDDNSRCAVFEDFMFQKLLVHQAQVDSLEVSDKQVDDELDRRLNYFLAQMGGSETEFEKHFNKSILEFKEEFRPIIKNNILAQQMRSKITSDVKITPAEVRQYFNKLPKDSLPLIPAKYELAQITVKPKMNSSERDRIYAEAQKIRSDLLKGKDFGWMAYIYSDDPGSKAKKGELGFVSRDQLVPEFAAVAFNLKLGEVSEIVETEYGFHIIMLIEKKGQLVNARHILKSPKIYPADIDMARKTADSLFVLLQDGKTSFGELASKYSSDPASRDHSGIITNMQTGDSKFMAEELDPEIAAEISVLKAGESGKPGLIMDQGGKQVFRILKLVSYTEAHTASMAEDFDQINSAALAEKQKEVLNKWMNKNIENTYTRVGEGYIGCEQSKLWLNHKN
ncbi:MAG: peptidylprolyl isomerase [Bacteroidetes bacterium]|nr:peptidylprolyl isomerase [Bacteroidota bacterium]